jgi:hypothetical protein
MKPRRFANGGPLKRHVSHKPGSGRARVLDGDHVAAREARSLFPSTVIHATMTDRLLKSGANSRKTGRMVTKGRWAGMPIYTLTLEERRTCPATCAEWLSCYGNNMHLAQRLIVDGVFAARLRSEVKALAKAHAGGFVVRLHVLGDFPSRDYVELWRWLLNCHPELRLFGYTARAMDDPIGQAVLDLNFGFYDRVRIRFSGTDAEGLGATVIDRAEDSRHVVCPAQTGATDCCGTCGLCWTMNRTVEFVRH